MVDLVFLGAGASKPFGIPTMQEMVIQFEEKLKEKKELLEFYNKIKELLVEKYGSEKVDIESMFSVIEGIEKKTPPEKLGHYAFYIISKNGTMPKIDPFDVELATSLKKELETYMLESCNLKLSSEKSTEIYSKSYLPFFSNLGAKKKKFGGGYTLGLDWKAYTTNYDGIFEGFWHSFHEPIDHFDRQGASNIFIFARKELGSQQTYCKLHGSLDWTKDVESGDVMRKGTSSFDTVKTEGQVLLYPIQQKDLYLHPWFTLFQDLKNGLLATRNWFVIGYAFNDEFIFNVFEESLAYGHANLIIINPNANSIKSNFSQKNQDRIITLPWKFGDDHFAENFKDFQKGVKNLCFEIKTDSPDLAIDFSSKVINIPINESNNFLDLEHSEWEKNKSRLKFFGGRSSGNELKLVVELDFDYKAKGVLEFKIRTDSQTPVKVNLTSHEQFIDTFTTSSLEQDEDGNWVYKKEIPIDAFI